MTDDELFVLSTRIHRIESSMISCHSTIKDEEVHVDALSRMYADLTQPCAQLDTALV